MVHIKRNRFPIFGWGNYFGFKPTNKIQMHEIYSGNIDNLLKPQHVLAECAVRKFWGLCSIMDCIWFIKF